MRMTFHLAALFTALTAATMHAQITDPNNLIAPPPPPIQFRGKHLIKPVTDLQWLWQYTTPAPDGNEGALLVDPHFRIMLADQLTAPQAFFREGNVPLADVARLYFGTLSGSVRSEGNRYIWLEGCVQHKCERQGLLWVDTAVQHPTVVFAATEWTTEGKPVEDSNATFNLWLFASRPLSPDHLPPSLVAAISSWNAVAPQHIQTALIIDPDGTPHKVDPSALGAIPGKTTTTAAPKK
jgi:hypothetical protein